MQFNILAEDLKAELVNVGRARDTNINLEAARGILFEVSEGKMRLSAANNEYAIAKTIDLNTGCYGGECSFVAGDEFIDVVNKLSDGVATITIDNDTEAKLTQKKFSCAISVMNSEKFVKKCADGNLIGTQTIKADVLEDIVKSVCHACAKNEYGEKAIRTGVKLYASNGRMEAVALDGCRIAICRADYNGDDIDVVLSGRMLKDILKLFEGNVEIKQYDDVYEITGNGYIVTASRLSGAFPDYKKILPPGYNGELRLSAKQLYSVIDRLDTVAKKDKKPVIFEYTDGELRASAKTKNSCASEIIDCSTEGETENIQIGFNGKMLCDALKLMEGDIKFKYAAKHLPLVFESEDERNIQVVMPIRFRD